MDVEDSLIKSNVRGYNIIRAKVRESVHHKMAAILAKFIKARVSETTRRKNHGISPFGLILEGMIQCRWIPFQLGSKVYMWLGLELIVGIWPDVQACQSVVDGDRNDKSV
jgi:hypothetical protein